MMDSGTAKSGWRYAEVRTKRLSLTGGMQMNDKTSPIEQIELAADIISAFVRNNSVPVADLSALIRSVHDTLGRLASGAPGKAAPEVRTPAVSIKKSITEDFLICLE